MFFVGLISSDEALLDALSEQLRLNDAWQHTSFSSLEDALAAWSDALPPLILWDAETASAKDDMLDFFAMRLEDKTPNPVVIVIGDAPQVIQKEGVAESLSRPVRLGCLLTRLQFYQRILQQAPDVKWPLGEWLFEPRAHRLFKEGSDDLIKLTDKEVAVLEYLYAATAPVPRDELLAAVWGYDVDIDTHTLETHIYRLRKKILGDEGAAIDIFTTEGGGYQIDPSWRSS